MFQNRKRNRESAMNFDDEEFSPYSGFGTGCELHGEDFLRECTMCGIEFCAACFPNSALCPDCAAQAEFDEDEEPGEEEKTLLVLGEFNDDEPDLADEESPPELLPLPPPAPKTKAKAAAAAPKANAKPPSKAKPAKKAKAKPTAKAKTAKKIAKPKAKPKAPANAKPAAKKAAKAARPKPKAKAPAKKRKR